MGGTESYDSGARPYDLPEHSPYGVPAYGTPPAHPGGVVQVGPQDMSVYPAATTPPPPWMAQRTDRVQVSGAGVAITWIITCFTSFYMLPWAIAMTRGKSDRWGIFWLNLLTGWTVVGWIGALIWSCMPHRTTPSGPVPVPPGWYPLANGRHAYWDGTRWTGHVA